MSMGRLSLQSTTCSRKAGGQAVVGRSSKPRWRLLVSARGQVLAWRFVSLNRKEVHLDGFFHKVICNSASQLGRPATDNYRTRNFVHRTAFGAFPDFLSPVEKPLSAKVARACFPLGSVCSISDGTTLPDYWPFRDCCFRYSRNAGPPAPSCLSTKRASCRFAGPTHISPGECLIGHYCQQCMSMLAYKSVG